jgi:hypothetical protein
MSTDVTSAEADQVDPVDALLVELLAAGRTHQEAGAAVGRSAKYVQRRLADPTFGENLKRRQRARLEAATALLRDGLEDAVSTIRANLNAERPADQLRAASLLISSYASLNEQVEVVSTLDELAGELRELRSAIGGT